MKIQDIIVDIIMLIIIWTLLVCVAPKETIKSQFDSKIIDYDEWIDTSKKIDTSKIEDNLWIR